MDVSLQLAAQMLRTAGLAETTEAALIRLREKLDSGAGLLKLAQMIEAQGGDPRVTEDIDLLPRAEKLIPVPAPEGGYVAAMRTSDIGYAAQALGAGRVKKTDRIDPAVGLVMTKRLGDPIEKGEPWCVLHVNPASDVKEAARLLEGALAVSREPSPVPKLVHAVIE